MQVRARAFGTPQERPVVDELTGAGVRTIAFHFRKQWANVLSVANAAGFANIDIPTDKL